MPVTPHTGGTMPSEIPVGFLLGTSVTIRSDLILAMQNRIAELKKMLKELREELLEEEASLMCAEYLEAKKDAIIEALSADARQMDFDFTTRRVVETRARTRTAA